MAKDKDDYTEILLEVNNVPELKLDHKQIDDLIKPEARIEAYRELFVKYLEAIKKEANPNKKRYYGYHLENLGSQINKDAAIELAADSKGELLSQIANFIDILKEPEQRDINQDAQKIIDNVKSYNGFEKSAAKCVTKQVSEYIEDNLIPWANEHGNTSLSAQLVEQEKKMWVTVTEKVQQYQKVGKAFWDKCLNFLDKMSKPKAIAFDVDKEAKKYETKFMEEKSSYISKALNFIKNKLDKNESGKILSSQIDKSMGDSPSTKSLAIRENFENQTTISKAVNCFSGKSNQVDRSSQSSQR